MRVLFALPWPFEWFCWGDCGWPCVNIIWLSSCWSSACNSFSLLFDFFTIVATSESALRSVATSLSFSAPAFIFNSCNQTSERTRSSSFYGESFVLHSHIRNKHTRHTHCSMVPEPHRRRYFARRDSLEHDIIDLSIVRVCPLVWPLLSSGKWDVKLYPISRYGAILSFYYLLLCSLYNFSPGEHTWQDPYLLITTDPWTIFVSGI